MISEIDKKTVVNSGQFIKIPCNHCNLRISQIFVVEEIPIQINLTDNVLAISQSGKRPCCNTTRFLILKVYPNTVRV
jgi:hypothetical protein